MSRVAKLFRTHMSAVAVVATVVVATAGVFVADGCSGDAGVIASFLAIIAIGTAGIVADRQALSLRQLFYLFIIVFMGLAPLSQYLGDETVWEPAPFTPDQYLKANLLVALCCAAFECGRRLARSPKRKISAEPPAVSPARLIALSAAAAVGVAVYYRYNLCALVDRTIYEELMFSESVMGILAVNYVLRSVPMMCLIVALAGRGASMWQKVALAVIAVGAAMPTAMPRQQVAALYLPAMVLAVPWLRGPKRLTLCLLWALLLLFPVMTALRGGAVYFLHSADFDAYEIMCRAVDRGYITWGAQLLGVLLFFVPRALWAAKPVASGYWMCYAENYGNDNLSMPLIGEGYLNFGIAGALGFTLLAGWGARWCDQRWATARAPWQTAYLVLLAYVIFLQRGPLMSAYSMLCCTLLALALAWLIALRRTKSLSHKIC